MDAKTLTALKGSIRKWEKIVAGRGLDKSVSNCPLCKRFWNNDCVGCPVMDKTGRDCCQGTPYILWSNVNDRRESPNGRGYFFPNGSQSKAAAVKEVKFLRSLLPKPKRRKA